MNQETKPGSPPMQFRVREHTDLDYRSTATHRLQRLLNRHRRAGSHQQLAAKCTKSTRRVFGPTGFLPTDGVERQLSVNSKPTIGGWVNQIAIQAFHPQFRRGTIQSRLPPRQTVCRFNVTLGIVQPGTRTCVNANRRKSLSAATGLLPSVLGHLVQRPVDETISSQRVISVFDYLLCFGAPSADTKRVYSGIESVGFQVA